MTDTIIQSLIGGGLESQRGDVMIKADGRMIEGWDHKMKNKDGLLNLEKEKDLKVLCLVHRVCDFYLQNGKRIKLLSSWQFITVSIGN